MKEFNEKTILEMIEKIRSFDLMIDYSIDAHYKMYNSNELYYNSEHCKEHHSLKDSLRNFLNLLYLDLGKMTHQKLDDEKKE